MKDIILIIDDAREDLDLFQAMLEEHGYKVTRACDGQEGLQKIKQDSPMVIVSDVMMPNMNGYALLKEIRHDHATSKIPVLIVTARPKMAEVFLEIGADSFIAKPINGDKFLTEVDKLVGRVKDTRLDGKKIVIFGQDERTRSDMRLQLENVGCAVVDIGEEKKIITAVETIRPDLFFLAVNVETRIPVDLLVHILNTWSFSDHINESPATNNPSKPHPMRIVLYEEEKETEKVWISDSQPTYYASGDKKALVQKCYKNGAIGSIGIYNPQHFVAETQRFFHY